jgi:hypothetical protein
VPIWGLTDITAMDANGMGLFEASSNSLPLIVCVLMVLFVVESRVVLLICENAGTAAMLLLR